MKKLMTFAAGALVAAALALPGAASAQDKDATATIGVSIPAATHGWTGGVNFHAQQAIDELEAAYPNLSFVLWLPSSSPAPSRAKPSTPSSCAGRWVSTRRWPMGWSGFGGLCRHPTPTRSAVASASASPPPFRPRPQPLGPALAAGRSSP